MKRIQVELTDDQYQKLLEITKRRQMLYQHKQTLSETIRQSIYICYRREIQGKEQ